MSLVRDGETKPKVEVKQETPSCKLCGLRHTLQLNCSPTTENLNIGKPTAWNIMPHLKSQFDQSGILLDNRILKIQKLWEDESHK